MEIKIIEYNVARDIEKRDEFGLMVTPDKIIYQGESMTDKIKIDSIYNLIEENKSDIIRLCQERAQNFKGGRQMMFTIKNNDTDEKYLLIGNTNLEEMANLYSKLKKEIINIINQ